ncbi:DUF6103 family protein [Ruminococcaceae bacterium OttesenSCG-928-L11]|nr:DUF6103 family protein [Ruminococcaceae bacterium OttesenSCG-928-L11]
MPVSFPTEKLEAVRHYAAEKDSDLTAELEDALQKLYERIVPKDVRAYLEVKEQAAPASRPRSPHPTAVTNATPIGEHHGQGDPRGV